MQLPEMCHLRFEPFERPGLQLMVLRGLRGPERYDGHDELFIATQVLQQVGLKDAKRQVQRYKYSKGMYKFSDIFIMEFGVLFGLGDRIHDSNPVAPFVAMCKFLMGPRWKDAWLCTKDAANEIMNRSMIIKAKGPLPLGYFGWDEPDAELASVMADLYEAQEQREV